MIFNAEFCIDCKMCEIACSFHHTGVFNPNLASIEILDNTRKDIKIKIYREKEKGKNNLNCDHCCGLDEEMCIKYCPMGEELKSIINLSRKLETC